jgi:hypothetical protein
MAKLFIKQAGAWVETMALYIKDVTVQRQIRFAYIKDAGVWRLVFGTPSSSVAFSSGASTWKVPAGVYSVTAQIISGGGAGGFSVQSGDIHPGSAGGSGGWTSVTFPVVPGSNITYSVGAGGVIAGVAGWAASGGASSVTYGATYNVTGGGGGYGPVGDNAAPAAGAGGSPNGVAGSNVYTSSVYRNSAVTEIGGVNSLGIGNGGNGRRGDGAVNPTNGGAGRITFSW